MEIVMAFKSTAQQVLEESPALVGLEDIVLEIDGLIPSSDGNFILRGISNVKTLPDPIKLVELLVEGGLDRPMAFELADKFMDMAFTHMLTKALAQRVRRIG
jgi:hypothetical protein